MKKNITKIGLTAFAFAMMFGLSVADTFAFGGDRAARPERGDGEGEHQKGERGERKGPGGEPSEEAKAFRAEQRAEFEDFIGLDEGELKELHDAGEKMSETLDDQNIDEDDMKEFLEEQLEDLIDFIIDEKDLDDDQVDTLEDRMSDRIEHQLERWYN